jgi:aldehyde:ferredoxin oxidoreductase
MRRVYWSEIGWDPETGIPTQKTISELELDDVVRRKGK